MQSIFNFIHIVGKYANYKLRIFIKKPYVFAIICLHKPNLLQINDIIDYNII